MDWLAGATIGSVILEARTPFDRDGGEPEAGWFSVAASDGPVGGDGGRVLADDPKRLKLEVDREFAGGETVTVSYRRPPGGLGLWGATPRIGMGLVPADGGEVWAAYEGGSGTAALTFAHTVAAADVCAGGVAVVADSLELDGGTIRSSANGQDADLSHAGLAADPAHKADGRIEPAAPSAPAFDDGAAAALSIDENHADGAVVGTVAASDGRRRYADLLALRRRRGELRDRRGRRDLREGRDRAGPRGEGQLRVHRRGHRRRGRRRGRG